MGINNKIRHFLSEFIAPQKQEETPPEQGEFISGIRDDLDIDLSARRANNPSTLASNMRLADEGDVSSLMEVYEEVERDPRISRLTWKRRNLVLSNKLVIELPDGDDSAQAQKATELCNDIIFGGNGFKGIESFDDVLFDLSDAIFKGFAVGQPQWIFDGGKRFPTKINRWSQKEFIFGSLTDRYKQEHDDIRVLTDSNRTDGEKLSGFPNGQWIVHVQKNWSQPIPRAALARSVTWFWMFKRFGFRDWSIFLERFGVPMRKATHRVNAGKTERDELWNAVRNLGKDHCCIVPEGSTIELIELHGTKGDSPHPLMIKHCNEEIDVAIMGDTMSVSQGDRGARSAKEAFQNDQHEQTKQDSNKLSKTIAEQLCRPIIDLNLGKEYPTPKCFFQLTDNDNLDVRSQVDERVAGIGYPITYGYIEDKYSIPLPKDIDRNEVIETTQGAVDSALSEAFELAEKKKISKTIMQMYRSREGSK